MFTNSQNDTIELKTSFWIQNNKNQDLDRLTEQVEKSPQIEISEKVTDKKYKKKCYKMTMKPYNWRSDLRNKKDDISQTLKSKFTIKKYKVDTRQIRNILEDQYLCFKRQNTHDFIDYQEYFNKLVEIGVISDDPNNTFNSTNRVVMPVFVPEKNQLFIKTGDKLSYQQFDLSYEMKNGSFIEKNDSDLEEILNKENYLQPKMDNLTLSIFNSFVENLQWFLEKYKVKARKRSKSKSKSKSKSRARTKFKVWPEDQDESQSSLYDNIITSNKMQRGIVLSKEILKLVT